MVKKEIFSALTGDAELVSLVGTMRASGSPCIFYSTPAGFNDLPAVSFFEKECGDRVFADNVCIARNAVVQVDVWAEDNASAVFDRADSIMRGLGYYCASTVDVPDPNARHITAVYGKLVDFDVI